MVGVAQAFGFALIRLALICLAGMKDEERSDLYSFVNVSVFWTPVLLLLWCWWEKLAIIISSALNGDPHVKPLSDIRREGRIINAVLFLVALDTAALIYLIKATGGLGHSPLDPLLPMIPIIAIILRQPRKTVMWAVGIQILSTPVIVLHRWAHFHNIAMWHPRWIDANVYHSEGDARFVLAFSIVAIGAIVLSVSEYNITHSSSLLLRDFRKLKPELKTAVFHSKQLLRMVKKGAKDWIQWLELHMFPPEDLSKVHDPSVVAFQSIILSLPYWKLEEKQDKANTPVKAFARNYIVRDLSFLTYAAHWIDDQFDPVRPPGDVLYESFQTKSPSDILQEDDRAKELIRRMALRTPYERVKQFMARTAWKIPNPRLDCIERAVIRIVFGGCIQNAHTPERLQSLLQDYVIVISEGLCPEIQQYYNKLSENNRLIPAWVTTKVVIELWDNRSADFSLDKAEFFNLLYGPILYYQDIDREQEQEHFGAGFGKPVDNGFPTLGELREMIEFCISLEKQMFQAGFPEGRRRQLELLRNMYRNKLPPEIYSAYNHFLGASQVTPKKALAVRAGSATQS
jgi:hypothetical protein